MAKDPLPPEDRVIICAVIPERCFSSVFSFKNDETRPQMQLFTPAKPDVWFALGADSNALLRSRTNITRLRAGKYYLLSAGDTVD